MVVVTIDPVRGTVELLHALEAPHLSVVVVCTRVSAGMILEAALLMGLTLREREGGPDVILRGIEGGEKRAVCTEGGEEGGAGDYMYN